MSLIRFEDMLSVGLAWQNFEILQRGRFGNESVLDRVTFDSILSLPFEGRAYELGWSIGEENGRPTEIYHSGSLASSRASMRINLDNGRYCIVFYALVEPDQSGQITQQLNRAIIRTIRQ